MNTFFSCSKFKVLQEVRDLGSGWLSWKEGRAKDYPFQSTDLSAQLKAWGETWQDEACHRGAWWSWPDL